MSIRLEPVSLKNPLKIPKSGPAEQRREQPRRPARRRKEEIPAGAVYARDGHLKENLPEQSQVDFTV
jgi:hypothetical protein